MHCNFKHIVFMSLCLLVGSCQLIAQEKREITGIISFQEKPIPDVSIRIQDTDQGTKTDAKGYYRITAKEGDALEYEHVGFKKAVIIVEDVTSEINLDMMSSTNTLEEITVTGQTQNRSVINNSEKANESFNSAVGKFDPRTAGYSIAYIDGDELDQAAGSLAKAIGGKAAGVMTFGNSIKLVRSFSGISDSNSGLPKWDVDGFIYDSYPFTDLTNIHDIHILKSLAATTRYGSLGRNGVIVVRTKSGYFASNDQQSKVANQYTNKSFYNDDALSVDPDNLASNDYSQTLEAFSNRNQAFDFYNKNFKHTIKDYDIQIGIAQQFLTTFKDKSKALAILNELAQKHNKNPEILKAIGFKLQAMDATKDALEVFKQVARLRPDYAQSFRDLANAYKENSDFKMSWRIYMYYLLSRDTEKAAPVDKMIYNEMEYLYFNRANQTRIKEQFVPNSENKVKFRNDVRFVIEWNTSEAEFDLEFVGPNRRTFVFEHSLAKNQKLITKEKLAGYSSSEFFVEEIGTKEWLMNLTYYGNKKSSPTYLKVTTYYHWGKPMQKKVVMVYRLEETNKKMQLKKINSQSLLSFN